MEEKTIFERTDCQNRIWKTGLYDYLFNSIFSIRFHICNFYIRMFFNQNADVLDVGAGSGTLFSFIWDIVKKYDYNDVAEEALKVFKNSNTFKEHTPLINILHDNINNITSEKKYDVIASLGVAKFIYEQDLFFNLFSNNLADGGIMLLETTESCDAFSYYCCNVPKPIHSIKYEILDEFDFNTSKTRILNVYKKTSAFEVGSNA